MMDVVVSNNSYEVDLVQKSILVANNLIDNNINFKKNDLKLNINHNDIQVNLAGNIIMNQLKFEWVEPPATRNSPGIPGQMSFDDDYLFICVAPNLWARTILTKGF